MSLDKEKILNGTPQKRFESARRSLSEEFTESNALDFFYEYVDKPLSFVIRNSRSIFSEPYKGFDFYLGVIKSGLMNPCDYAEERAKVDQYLNELKEKADVVHSSAYDKQISMYQSLLESIDSKISETSGMQVVLGRASLVDPENFIGKFFDSIYESEKSEDKACMDEIVSILRSLDDIPIKMALSTIVSKRYPEYLPLLNELTRMPIRHCGDSNDWYKQCVITERCISNLMRDADTIIYIKKVAEKFPVYCDMCSTWANVKNGIYVYEKCDNRRVKPTIDTSFVPTPLNAVSAVFEMAEDREMNAACDIYAYDSLTHKHILYEVMLEEAVADYSLGINDLEYLEYCEDLVAASEYSMYFMEWEANGQPNAVIAKQIKTQRDIDAETKKKESERKSAAEETKNTPMIDTSSIQKWSEARIVKAIQNWYVGQNTPENVISANMERVRSMNKAQLIQFVETNKMDITAKDTPKKVEAAVKQINIFTKEVGERSFESNEDFDEYVSDCKKKIAELTEGISKNTDIVEAIEAFEKEVSDMKGLYESGDTEAIMEACEHNRIMNGNSTEDIWKSVGMSFLEAEDDPKAPKKDLATKIQDKVLDHEASAKKRQAIRAEKIQKLKNAGNALSERPKEVGSGVETAIDKFDKWDDNRRKAYMAKPGFRKKLFKKLKTAILYGSVAKINIAWMPVTWMLRHFSKEKDKRIRNELIMELESEIKICEEKINDAAAKSDNETKYQLMRIKDKLEAEATRVRINANNI